MKVGILHLFFFLVCPRVNVFGWKKSQYQKLTFPTTKSCFCSEKSPQCFKCLIKQIVPIKRTIRNTNAQVARFVSQEGCKSKKQHKSYNATITRIPSKRNAEKAQFEKVPTPIDGMLEVNSDGTRQEKLNAVQRNSMLNWTDFNDKGSETELLDILKTDSTNFGLRAKQRMFEKAIQIVSNILHPTNPKYLIENLNIESSSKKDMNEVSLNNFIENICHLYFGG